MLPLLAMLTSLHSLSSHCQHIADNTHFTDSIRTLSQLWHIHSYNNIIILTIAIKHWSRSECALNPGTTAQRTIWFHSNRVQIPRTVSHIRAVQIQMYILVRLSRVVCVGILHTHIGIAILDILTELEWIHTVRKAKVKKKTYRSFHVGSYFVF